VCFARIADSLASTSAVAERPRDAPYHYFTPGKLAKYCDQYVCVCLPVCLSVRLPVSKTGCQNFYHFCLFLYPWSLGHSLTAMHCFSDDVMFSHNGAGGSEWKTTRSLYRPGSTVSTAITDNFFTELTSYLEVLALYKCQVVIAGDFNIRVEKALQCRCRSFARTHWQFWLYATCNSGTLHIKHAAPWILLLR